MTSKNAVYVVNFRRPPVRGDKSTLFFFSSLAAIYARFSTEEVGCCIQSLYNRKVAKGGVYEGKKCRVSREPIQTSPQRSFRRGCGPR